MNESNEKGISDIIGVQAQKLCVLDLFSTWETAQNFDKGDLVLVNNSFIYRDKIRTTKNPLYLSFSLPDGSLETHDLKIASGVNVNADFKAFKNKQKDFPTILPFSNAIEDELTTLGQLVFILIGSLDTSEEFSEPIGHSLFSLLHLKPDLGTELDISGKEIQIREIIDDELIWNKLGKLAIEKGFVTDELPNSLLQPFLSAYSNLRKNCYITLTLPINESEASPKFLDSIIDALMISVDEYRISLEKCKGSSENNPLEYKNILRIAYNFASEAVTIIRLIVSICDLKPVLYWMTISDHILLAEAFRNLPWKRSNKKPSLDIYLKTIGNARNQAFHHIFPFDRTIDVRLDGVSIVAKRLRLFSEFTSRKNNTFEYEDQQLVELLTEFTRADETYVSPEFWSRNLNIMQATIDLLSATSLSLKLLIKTVSII